MAEQNEFKFWDEIISPINLVLICLIIYLIVKIVKSKFESEVPVPPPPPQLPKIRKDMTVAELKQYNGTNGDGRILLAVNNIIFDVTKGKGFYGPGGPYSVFAGRDATRGLATGQVAATDKDYDDVSDLTADELQGATEWELQFKEKYEIVGRLLKPGESPSSYSDNENEATPEEKKEL